MDKKKLSLEQLKVKSFVTLMNSTDQKTAKGGYLDVSDQVAKYKHDWTSIKTQKSPYNPTGGLRIHRRR